jgi:glutaredoxin-related protein
MDINCKDVSIEWINVKSEKFIKDVFKPLIKNHSKIKILSYLSEWCPDCINQITALKNIHDDYKKFDLTMMIVMDYSQKKDSEKFIKNNDISIPFSFGELFEKNETLRLKTDFYKFRETVNDNRKWGVPFHFILVDNQISKVGIIKGEFKDEEIRAYIIKNL